MDEPRHEIPLPWQQAQFQPQQVPWAGQVSEQRWASVPRSIQPSSRHTTRTILMWLGYPTALIIGIIIGVAPGGSDGAKTVNDARTANNPGDPATQEQTDAAAPDIGPANFQITVKTLSKQCFGSAGCNVEIRLGLGGDADTEGVAAELTVKVTGDESGPLIETISVDEDGNCAVPELTLSTKSSGTKVKAKVTAVEVQ